MRILHFISQLNAKIWVLHIYFFDHLFNPCSPYSASYQIVHNSLIDFHKFPGLQPNKGNSRVYFGGITDHDKATLYGLPGFQCGPLTVKYLGLSLISTKLTTSEFSLLID